MPKLRLSLDDLQVTSFMTAPPPHGKGTVHGAVEQEKFIPFEETPWTTGGGTLGTTDILTTVNQTVYPQVTCAFTCVGTCFDTCANSCAGSCNTCPICA